MLESLWNLKKINVAEVALEWKRIYASHMGMVRDVPKSIFGMFYTKF